MKYVIMTAQIGHYHNARFRAFADKCADFSVLAAQNEGDFPEFMAEGEYDYRVHQLFSDRATYLDAVRTGALLTEVQCTLEDLDPEVVAVAGWATPESFAAILWARKRRRRVVMLSDSKADDAERSRWRELIKARIVRLSDAALVGGPEHVAYISSLGIPADRTFTGYDVVDNNHFIKGADAAIDARQDNQTRFELPERYVLASSRFVPKKNLLRLIRAYHSCNMRLHHPPHLVILGDGPERGLLEEEIAKLNLGDYVLLPGFQGYASLPAFYGLSEGFIHVPTSEQWGLVINEAAASAVPIVCSSACGAAQSLVKPGENGFVVDANDEASIATALAKLLALPPLARQIMGQTSRRLVADWGPERFCSGLMSAFEASETNPVLGLAKWDLVLLRFLSRRTLSKVA
jgi:glycosyltransferase involved in cell wall biosynthesis